jgi:hypothetical protein
MIIFWIARQGDYKKPSLLTGQIAARYMLEFSAEMKLARLCGVGFTRLGTGVLRVCPGPGAIVPAHARPT